MKEVKRCVSTGFWNDDKVLNDFSPEDKYFMLYLLTNPYTTQLGVYHLPLKKVALELGYSLEAVNTLLDRFERKYRIIKFNRVTSEIAIKNYLKHSVIKGGKPVMDCLEKDLKGIKDLSLVGYVFSHISESVNDTVHEFINTHLDIKDNYIDNDNDNDNDNERYVDDSYHDSSKPVKEPKHKYGEYCHVRLTDDERNKLMDEYGEAETTAAIKYLDEYIEMKGYKAKSHYLCIKKWVFEAVNRDKPKQTQSIEDMWRNA